MSITTSSLNKINEHWAVLALGDEKLKKVQELSTQLMVEKAIGNQFQFGFTFTSSDYELLDKAALVYEMAAIEGFNEFLSATSANNELREQCAAGAYKSFEIRRLLKIPTEEKQTMFYVLHLSSLAYCGDRWTDLRRWYNENSSSIRVPTVASSPWDERLLKRLFECWIRLFRKRRWDDLDRIREIIAGLREDQKQYEAGVLNEDLNQENRAMAFRLICMYHWAKATEIQVRYMLQGEPAGVVALLDKHFESAVNAAVACADSQLEIILRWIHIAARQMIKDSIWWVARSINSRVTKFVREVTRQQALFELLPPQRIAIQEMGLLDQAATAVVVDMPTSGGKTLLAQFRILQALNQYDQDDLGKGWIAYVAPTKALSAQISRRLRRDFEPIGIKVEQLSGAIEIDAFEEDILSQTDSDNAFDVLIATPEKLQLIIRNKKVTRPLALVVMDEAHNIENESRGLRIELLLATIKAECNEAKFLLLMPFVEKPEVLARWLAHDINTGKPISLGTTPWKPNERILGMFKAESDESVAAGWKMKFETLTTSPRTIHLGGAHNVGNIKPLNIPKSRVLSKGKQKGLSLQTAAMARIMSKRGTSIAVARTINDTWTMARAIKEVFPKSQDISEKVELVQNFLSNEISVDFELVEMLSHGIAVHHAGLSDEARALIEWLAEENELKVLCATSTISQGINFPVSSVFLATRFVPKGKYCVEILPRDFWNLAGCAGRLDHDSVGVIGLAAGCEPNKIIEFVSKTTGELVSRLVKMLDDLEANGKLNELDKVIQNEQWEDYRCYIAHLWSEKENLDEVLSNTEQLLRNTFGYGILESRQDQKDKTAKLLEVTKDYIRKLSENPGHASLADMTGFSPEGIAKALVGISNLENRLTVSDWQPDSLFGSHSGMSDLYGIMLKIPQLKRNLDEITSNGLQHSQIAELTKDWVNGKSMEEIAKEYFTTGQNATDAITRTCKAIYKTLVNNGTWGLSALSRLYGLDFENMNDLDKRKINLIPAMIYHGVKSEEGVLLRMNSVPRSIAESLGTIMKTSLSNQDATVRSTRTFLKNSEISVWDNALPKNSHLSGEEYKRVWKILSGEE